MTSIALFPERSAETMWTKDAAFDRIRQTSTFRGRGFDRWSRAIIGIVGAGLLGARIALEIVRSGARVWICDFDSGRRENLGTQCVAEGLPKVDSVLAACNAIWPGRAEGEQADIRHIGIGVLKRFNVLLDCSDDAGLALPLTRISNGIGRPLLRCALDGSGEREFGRVLCSDGGRGRACQACAYSIEDLLRHRRTPCPGEPVPGPVPTLAGGPIGAVIAGTAVLQAQRLVTGNDRRLVFNREILIDLSSLQLLAFEHRRSPACLSGHVRWRLHRLGMPAGTATLADVFAAARERLGSADVMLEPYGHPLSTYATCTCGRGCEAVGAVWATPPFCPRCAQPMAWRQEASLDQLTAGRAAELGILRVPVCQLGLPDGGAMFVARADRSRPLHLVLDQTVSLTRCGGR